MISTFNSPVRNRRSTVQLFHLCCETLAVHFHRSQTGTRPRDEPLLVDCLNNYTVECVWGFATVYWTPLYDDLAAVLWWFTRSRAVGLEHSIPTDMTSLQAVQVRKRFLNMINRAWLLDVWLTVFTKLFTSTLFPWFLRVIWELILHDQYFREKGPFANSRLFKCKENGRDWPNGAGFGLHEETVG